MLPPVKIVLVLLGMRAQERFPGRSVSFTECGLIDRYGILGENTEQSRQMGLEYPGEVPMYVHQGKRCDPLLKTLTPSLRPF